MPQYLSLMFNLPLSALSSHQRYLYHNSQSLCHKLHVLKPNLERKTHGCLHLLQTCHHGLYPITLTTSNLEGESLANCNFHSHATLVCILLPYNRSWTRSLELRRRRYRVTTEQRKACSWQLPALLFYRLNSL